MKKLLLLSFIISGFLLTGCSGFLSQEGADQLTPSATLGSTLKCYELEENVAFSISRSDYKNGAAVRYVRLYKRAYITKDKVASELKKIKSLNQPPLSESEIYAYSGGGNWQGKSLDGFLLVKLEVQEGQTEQRVRTDNALAFDIYVDEELSSDLPAFIKNCQPQGGAVIVPELGTDLSQQGLPYPYFKKEDINLSGSLSESLDNFYVKVASVGSVTEGSAQIGSVSMGGKTYEAWYHLGAIYLKEGEAVFQYSGTNEVPPQIEGSEKSVKLGQVHFTFLNSWNWYTPSCKPVIYLYPPVPKVISIWLSPRGYLTKAEPAYHFGWENLWANGDGTVFSYGKSYPYLFYEAEIGDFLPPKTGFVIKKENLASFFDEILPKLGLNPKEARDFTDYWLKRLKDHPFFRISLLERQGIEEIEPVEFSETPDTFIRVRFYFEGLDSFIFLTPPEIPLPPVRKGFTVVEWGGLYQPESLKGVK